MQLTGMKTKMWHASRNMYDWSMKQAESIDFLSLDRSRFRFTSLQVEEDVFPGNALLVGGINRIILHSIKRRMAGPRAEFLHGTKVKLVKPFRSPGIY